MRIKSELLWGESIRDKRKVFDLLQKGKLPLGYYLLLCTNEGEIECIPSFMQNNKAFTNDIYTVFGIALSKEEAYEMIREIVSYVYSSTLYSDLKGYVREVLVTEVC